jgi:hypothetical protein
MVKTELVVPSEVKLEGTPVGEGKAELTSGVGSEDWDGSSKLPPAIEVSTAADSTADGAVLGSVELMEAVDAEASDAGSSADELISDTLDDGSSSIDAEEIMDGVGSRVEISEDSDGPTEAGIVEEARSPSWDVGEGVDDVLDTDEDSAEGDTVAMEAPSRFEDEGSRIADSEVEEGSAERVIEGSSSWAVDLGEETAEVDIADKEAVLEPVESPTLILDPVDSVGWTDWTDSEADKPPASPTPSTNTMQNLWLGSSTNTKHFCSITPTDLSSAKS